MFWDLTLISFSAEADDGANDGASESNDAVVTDVATEENGVADVVVVNDDTNFLCDVRLPRVKNTGKLKLKCLTLLM